MALLGQPRQAPPDGWRYTQPETQTTMEEVDGLVALAQIVVKHRNYKGMPRATVEEAILDIQRQICASMPPGVCRPEPGEDYQPIVDQSRRLTLEKIQSFSLAMFEWVKSGGNFVDEEESLRRAKICLGCPYNKAPHACACSPLWVLIKALVPKKRQIDNLHVCGVCGCVCSVLVLMPLEVLADSERSRDLVHPPHCWKHAIKGLKIGSGVPKPTG